MDVIILLIVLQMVSLIGAYEFTCPSQAHWRLRAKSTCKPPSNYTCLFDINLQINIYRDRCNRPRILGPGYKYVFQPNLNRAACSGNRYQPFIFETDGYSECTYQKSLCNSLGQETYEIGDTTVDRKCICNTNRGYTFITSSAHQCYCNPSTEDCSCYLGINPYNETIGLRDIKCYHELKITRSPHLGDMFNISQKIEFDNYKYNLKHIPNNKYRIEAAKWVLVMSLANFVVCIVLLMNWRRLQRSIEMHSKSIFHLPEEDKIRFNKLLQTEKTEKRYFVRIMIVGKESTGKTCLLRRLLKKSLSGVKSTDGVDIVVRRCKINIEDGKWIIGKDIDNDKVGRIKGALNQNAEDGDIHNMQIDEANNVLISQRDEKASNKEDITSNAAVSQDKSKDKNEFLPLETPDNSTSEAKAILHKNEDVFDSSSFEMHEYSTTHTRDMYKKKVKKTPLVMPEDLMSHVFSKSTVNTPSNLYALCELWDFAGQREFYATHQAFLTSSAVYLVVADMKDDIRKSELSQCFADFQHVGEYVEFWFDSIHCHRTDDERATNGYFHPPILLVFTGKDKYDKADFEKRQKELTYQIDQAFGFKSKYHHLHKQFYLSNLKDTDEEFEKLRYEIYKTAKNMDNWGNLFPLKWVLLEHLIEINKNNGQNFIKFTEMSKLAKHSDININNADDLLLFLRFQHIVGNIIFFENIQDLIILNPQWLADAFRCLVSDRVDNSEFHHREDWTLFIRQGKISESLITELFKAKDKSQFLGQTNNLHAVMEKLDILVKIENSSYYIMPSMMPSSTFDDVCDKCGIIDGNCNRTSWLCFKFKFLPPSFFNHLSAWFIRNYFSSKVDGGIALYRGICMFDIDRSGGTKILVTMSTDTIALQVVTFSEQQMGLEILCSSIYNKVTQLFKNITERYKVKISFKLHFQCSDGYYFQDTFEYEKLKTVKELFCTHHKQMHRSDQMYSPWMNNEVKRIPDRVDIGNKQDDHNQKNEPNKEDVQDQTSVKTNLPVSVNLRKQLKIKQSTTESLVISSCIKTDNTLVFTDSHNKRLIICNSDGTDIDHIPLSYQPLYITEIDSNTVAVTCLYDITILIINISTRSVTSTLNTRRYYWGISYNDNNLYVVIGGGIIHVMDLTGKVIRTIPVPSYDIRDITVDRDRLVCIDQTSIYCCSLEGKVMWEFKKDGFQDLRGVTTDNEGNVYVTDQRTNTVIVVSDDGKHHRELLTKSDGLNNPYGIYFDKKENILLVCNESNEKAFLFDVKKNKNKHE